MTDDIVARLRERTTLRYAGNCKCGSCQLVPRELIQRIIVALDERDAKPTDEIERLRAALERIAQHDMQAIALDALRLNPVRTRPAKEVSNDAAT